MPTCSYLNDSAKKTLCARSDRQRLSMHCRDNDEYEQYVLQEYQVYRGQRLLTPRPSAVRLARVTYVDSEKGDTVATRWGFLRLYARVPASPPLRRFATTGGFTPWPPLLGRFPGCSSGCGSPVRVRLVLFDWRGGNGSRAEPGS